MSAIFNLLANILMTGTSIIGVTTIINKVGKFCKIIDENKKDGFKIGFDTIMLESINDINNCVEAISTISNNSSKILFILYDISVGNKYVKKDKDGKIIICSKLKVYSGFKDKIEELNSKVKKYQEELTKLKKNKKTKNDGEKDDKKDSEDSSDESEESSSINNENTYSDVSSDSVSDEDSDEEVSNNNIPKKNNKKKENNDEFYLESQNNK
jgi:hypothetical protein